MRRLSRLAILATFGVCFGTAAQETSRGVEEISSCPQHLTAIDEMLYFSADDGVHGRELWMSDESGLLRMVADIEPGAGSSSPEQIVGAGGLIVFRATTLSHGTEPWVYDRLQRKAQILRDIVPGPLSSSPVFGGIGKNGIYMLTYGSDKGSHALWTIQMSPPELTLVAYLPSSLKEYAHATLDDGRFFFGVNKKLMCSDGTPEGTRSVCESEAMLHTQWLTALNDKVVFAADALGCGNELWASDGTTEGTRMLMDIRPGEMPSAIAQLYAHQGRACFQADDGQHGLELWVTDGTPEGTHMVKDIAPGKVGSDPHYFLGISDAVYFAANDGVAGTELWRTDGTSAGTVRVSNLTGASGAGSVWSPASFREKVFFCADSSDHGEEVFRFDPKTGEVSLLKDIVPGPAGSGPDDLTPHRYCMFFVCNDGVRGEELWLTDGTEREVHIALDLRAVGVEHTASSSPTELTAFGNGLLFAATDIEHGAELWTSDGSDNGTVLLADIAPGPDDAAPRDFCVFEQRAFFSAQTAESGRELYFTDGSTTGTRLVRDIRPGPAGSEPKLLLIAGDRLFFTAEDADRDRVLWCSSGSLEGTRPVADIVSGLSNVRLEACAEYDGLLYLAGQDTAGIRKVFRLDLAKSELRSLEIALREVPMQCSALLEPDSMSRGVLPLPRIGDAAFFGAYTAEHGRELWVAHGGAREAKLLADAFPGRASSCPTCLTILGNRLLFIAEDPQLGRVLFQSDGTPEGTAVCRPFDLGGPAWPPIKALEVAALDEHTLILAAPHPTRGEIGEGGLHVLSGKGENLVLQPLAIPPARYHLPPHQLTASGGLVYFTCDDGVYGEELWATDGTSTGTRLIRDILSPAHTGTHIGNQSPLQTPG